MAPRLHPLAPAALGLVLALGLTACGGSYDTATGADAETSAPAVGTPSGRPSGPASSPPPATEQAATAVTVTAVDFELQVDGDDLRAGAVEVTFVNDGSSTHDLVVERDGEEIGEAEDVDPGGSSTVALTLEPGEYVLFCSIANHRAMGMEATIHVS